MLITLARADTGTPVCFWMLPWLHDLYRAEWAVQLALGQQLAPLVPWAGPPSFHVTEEPE